MAQLSEKAVAHQELNSIIRNAFFLSRSSNGVKNKDEIADSWKNYKDRINLDKINYQAKTRLAVDMILDNDIDFDTLSETYWESANSQPGRSDVQLNVLSSLKSSVRKEAVERAEAGEWTTATDKWLTDEERDACWLREQEEKEAREFD